MRNLAEYTMNETKNETALVVSINANTPPKKTEMELRSEDFGLKYADKKFLYEVMSIPTLSSYEYRMVMYIIMWAKQRNIEYKLDDYGNLYLTKGNLNDGEYYPCVTAHLDTVQSKHKAFILAGAELDIRTRINKENKHELYVDDIGIGADDKGAIFIGLSMIDEFDTIKGAFFLEEEIGMKGSDHMDESFFDNVGYVIGFDSPDKNRSAWKCSGTKLFDSNFYINFMKPVCDKYGYTKFYSEPYTDIKKIVESKGLVCMNFCNGGYDAHDITSEYIVAEETDNALGMGIELVETIGKTLHKISPNSETDTTDNNYMKTLGDDDRYGSYYRGYGYGGTNNNKDNNNNTSTTKTNNSENSVSEETVKYIVDVYEEAIANIKLGVETVCQNLGIKFDEHFKDIFNQEIKF